MYNSLPQWTDYLKKGVLDNYIKLIIISYKDIKNHPFTKIPKEDTRRNLLRKSMILHQKEYGIIYNIVAESGLYNEMTYEDTGRIDICCYLNELEDNYIAFECKRFIKGNIIPSNFTSQYVGEGMNRFINNVYSKNIGVGGMISFAESGSYKKLKELLQTSLPKTSINNDISDLTLNYNYEYIFRTKNERFENEPIELTHILMDFTK